MVGYFPGSSDYGTVTSSPLTFSIWPAMVTATTTTLAASPQSPISGQTATLTATVATSPASGETPGVGVVDFEDTDTGAVVDTASLVSGTATYTTGALSTGVYHFIACYSGDGENFAGSTSNPIAVSVLPKPLPIPSVSVTDAGGEYNGSIYPATATVEPTGESPEPTLEGVSPTLTYYVGDSATGKPLGGAPLVAGTYTVVAYFPGSTDYGPATSKPAMFSIDPAMPLVSVSDAGGTYNGSPFAATALVAGVVSGIDSMPSPFLEGVDPTVTYYAGSTAGGTPLPAAPNDAGTYTAVASFPGSTDYTSATSTPVTFVIGRAGTATSLTSSSNASTIGQTVTFTATVTPVDNTVVSPTGSVDFYDVSTSTDLGTVALTPGVNGGPSTAEVAASSLGAGPQTIAATYKGNPDFSGSDDTASPYVQDVQIGTTTAVSSTPNPAASGQSVTFSATVTANSGTFDNGGAVQFLVDGTVYGTPVPVNGGQASISDAGLSVGTHTIGATYSGDTDFGSSSGTASRVQTVTSQTATTTAVSTSPNPSLLGQWVTFNATVTANWGTFDDGGTVQFYVDGKPFEGQVPLDGNGQASVSDMALTLGTHAITATYSGDSGFGGSSGTAGPVEDVQIGTKTLVSLSPNPSLPGQLVTFTATVSCASGTFDDGGTVQFAVDGTNVGPAETLNSSGQASLPDSTLSLGTHTIIATYSGDPDFSGSSGSGGQTVNPQSLIATTTVVSSSASPSVLGQSVTFIATVTAVSGTFDNGGSVQFAVDGTTYGSPVILHGGVATVSDSALTAGTHTVTASYSGDGDFCAGSNSLSGGQTVNTSIATTTAVSSSQSPSTFGQSVIFTATVTPISGTFDNGGWVQFAVDGTSFGNLVLLHGGAATISDSALTAGTHTITAGYSGDSSFSASSGALSGGQVVHPVGTTLAVRSSLSSSAFAQSVTFTATVTPASGTFDNGGSVQFAADGSNFGAPVTLSNGVASISDSGLTVGTHTITASYSGDTDFNAKSGTLSTGQTVQPVVYVLNGSANGCA